MFNKVDVYWSPYGGNGAVRENRDDVRNAANILWFEPQPLIKHVVEERNKNVLFLKCPAFTDLYKNTYVIRSPFDMTLVIANDPTGSKYVNLVNDTAEIATNFIVDRKEDENNVFKMMSFSISYLFYSKQSVELEIYPPVLSMHTSDTLRNISVICGKFDISKWIRPIDFAFEIIDDFKPVIFKRGDPIFYVKFNTNKKVNLIRTELNQNMETLINSEISLKRYIPGNSLKQNYEFAKPLIELYKKLLFKKRCPFK